MSAVILSALILFGASDDAHKLVHKFKEGDVMKYSIVRESADSGAMMPGAGGTWNVEVKVESVKDGDVVLSAKKTVEKLDMEDQPMINEQMLKRMKAASQATITLKKDGAVDVKSPSGLTVMGDFGQWYRDFLLAKFPEGNINIGDTWEEKFKRPAVANIKNPKDEVVTYKLEGMETIDGVICYRISAASTSDQDVTGKAALQEGEKGTEVNFSIHRSFKYVMFLASDTGTLIKKSGTEEMQVRGENMPEIPPMTTNLTVKLAKR